MTADTPHKAVHVLIRGRVQGVGFRDWVARKAANLELDGWVRNLSDGHVEAVFSGNIGAVLHILEHCRKGPSLSRVDDVEVLDEVGAVKAGFYIRATA